MGAIISVDTDRVIRIEGVDKLYGYDHHALTDRIEAASLGVRRAGDQGRRLPARVPPSRT